VNMSSHINIVLQGGSPAAQYNFNSISLAGGSEISIRATSSNQGVLVNVVGKTNTGADIPSPIDFTGGPFPPGNPSRSCTPVAGISAYDASMLQILYGGTGSISMKGNSAAAATFYAPNAQLTLVGTADVYGSVLAKRINETGTANIHYDRRLQRDFYVAGHPPVGPLTSETF